MLGEQITTQTEITSGQLYVVYDADAETPVGAVHATGVDDDTVYGVDYQTGERVVLRPITVYVEQRRLTSVDSETALSSGTVLS